MNIGPSRAHRALRQIVRQKSVTKTVTRFTKGREGRLGGNDPTSSTHSVDMHLFDPESNIQETQYGERLGGDLQGMALPGADIQASDQVDHGAHTYEVSEEPVHIPSEKDKVLKLFALEKVVN